MPSGIFAGKLKHLFDEISDICEQHKPDTAAVETVFHARNSHSALQLGQARGVILLGLINHHCEIFEYTALQVKSAITGYGRAEKGQLKRMVELLLGAQFPNSKYDLTDALGLAVTHAHVSGFLSRLRS